MAKNKRIFKLLTLYLNDVEDFHFRPRSRKPIVIGSGGQIRIFKHKKIRMMKYKQKQPYGCGLYAVANACNLENFITEERLEASKKGNVIGQLSKWMQEDGHPFYIDTLYYNHVGKKLPASALEYVPKGEGVNFLPILINVRFSDEGKNRSLYTC